jgi:hypothetical protein
LASQRLGTAPQGRSLFATLLDEVVFFAFWQRAQTRLAQWTPGRQWSLLGVFILIGVVGRLWAQTSTRNFDFDSWVVVSSHLLDRGLPHDTGRYNYGPVWAIVLVPLRLIAEDPDAFRVAITVFLTTVDIGIAYLLMRRGYLLAACVLLIAPVSIAISGQHQQFDNLAIFFALAAMFFVPRDKYSSIGRWDVLVVSLLSLSLMTKHLFIIFPLWLALQQRSLRRALLYLAVPPIAFLLSFTPLLLLNRQPVIDYVFKYRSSHNTPMLNAVLPDPVATYLGGGAGAVVIFLGILILLGFLFRNLTPFESALVYSVSLVVFTSAVTDQYLAIAVVGAAAFLNIGLLYWFFLSSAFLVGRADTLNWPVFNLVRGSLDEGGYQELFAPIFAGWILMSIWLLNRRLKQSP